MTDSIEVNVDVARITQTRHFVWTWSTENTWAEGPGEPCLEVQELGETMKVL